MKVPVYKDGVLSGTMNVRNVQEFVDTLGPEERELYKGIIEEALGREARIVQDGAEARENADRLGDALGYLCEGIAELSKAAQRTLESAGEARDSVYRSLEITEETAIKTTEAVKRIGGSIALMNMDKDGTRH